MEDTKSKELLELIYNGTLNNEAKLKSIEVSLNNLEDKQKEIYITLYGDGARGIKGLSYHIEKLRSFMDRYKKWEVGIAFIAGFLGFIGTLVALSIAVLEYFKR